MLHRSRAEALSEFAIELAGIATTEMADAADALLERSPGDRSFMESVHALHLQRLARRPSDDFSATRALRIIEIALQRLPRHHPNFG